MFGPSTPQDFPRNTLPSRADRAVEMVLVAAAAACGVFLVYALVKLAAGGYDLSPPVPRGAGGVVDTSPPLRESMTTPPWPLYGLRPTQPGHAPMDRRPNDMPYAYGRGPDGPVAVAPLAGLKIDRW